MTGAIVKAEKQLNIDSDPEEGEILDGDDYEVISSDELNEANVRLRIRELEARNDELEKIANISMSYSRKFKYLQRKHNEPNPTAKFEFLAYNNKSSRVPTDATSVSSVEFHPAKKRRNRRQLRRYRKNKNRNGTTHHFIENGFQSKKHNQVKRCIRRKRNSLSFDDYNPPQNKNSVFKRISLDSLQSSDNDAYDSRNSRNVLIRDKLRFALARSPMESSLGSLKDRLQNDKDILCVKQKNTFIDNNIAKVSTHPDAGAMVDIPSDNSMSLDEQELRLIALKSAVMKKHFARKKRNAEVAYSPTDFVELGDSSSYENTDLMNVGFYDYQNGMDISPLSSPVLGHLDLDSIKCKEIESIAYNKPIDMDIANSESDMEHLPCTEQSSTYFKSYPEPDKDQSNCASQFSTMIDCMDSNQGKPFHPHHLHSPAQENTQDMGNEAEEEEAALRALLLAKLPTSKTTCRSKSQKTAAFNRPTESILKEAVRRLTIKTNCGNKGAVIEQVPQNLEFQNSECNAHSFDENLMHNNINKSAASNLPFFTHINISDTTESSLSKVELTNLDLNEQLQKECVSNKEITKIENIVPKHPLQIKHSVKVKEVASQAVIASNKNIDQIYRPIQNKNTNAVPPLTKKPICKNLANTENVQNKKLVPTYDVRPATERNMVNVNRSNSASTMKIVKPNKVINKVHHIKRKGMEIDPAWKKFKASEETRSTDSRLLTSTSLPKIKVPKLVIALGHSDTDIDDENLSPNNVDMCYNTDSLYDNASPLSLPMDTQCQVTPVCSNSPTVEFDEDGHNPPLIVVNNDIFEQKLDSFLRNVRNKIGENSKQNSTGAHSQKGQSTYDTPMAVRHLPPASQLEYKKLIMRMHILERQKITTSDKPKASNSEICESMSKDHSSADEKKKSTVVKTSKCDNSSPQFHTLQTYEKSYLKTGTVIISNLEKSLSLVDELKKAKISKLRHEERLKDLHAQIEDVQRKYLHDQQIIKKLSPSIANTNNVITTLKQRWSKYQKAAKELGKTLQGENYRLNGSLNKEISQKLKRLASDIKNVNSINYSNIKNVENVSCVKENSAPKGVTHENEDKSKETVKSEEPKSVDKINNNDTKLSDPLNLNAAKLIVFGMKQTTTDQYQQKDVLEGDASKQNGDSSVTCTDSSVLGNYVSPLVHLNCNQSQLINPNGVICPYELRGRCEDEECNFEHFIRKCERS